MTLIGLAGRRGGGTTVERDHSRTALTHLIEKAEQEITIAQSALDVARRHRAHHQREHRRLLRWLKELDA